MAEPLSLQASLANGPHPSIASSRFPRSCRHGNGWMRSRSGRAPRQCPICNGREIADAKRLGTLDVTLGPVRDRGLGPERFDLVCCRGCELIFLSPLPPQEMLDILYIHSPQFDGSVYGGSRAKVIVEFHRLRLEEIRTRQLSHSFPRWLWKFLKRRVIRQKDARVLEIGAGLSWMSRAAKLLIARTTTVAQDISSEAAESCPWVDHYYVGPLESKVKEIGALGPFDVVSMTHVIEHLPDPVQVLRQCSALLADQGMVFVSAPFRPAGWSPSAPFELWKHWSLNHTPAHLQYFNRKSMERCAIRSGLQLAKYEPDKDAFVALLKQR